MLDAHHGERDTMGNKGRRSPLWARLCLIGGIVLAVASAGTYVGTAALASRVNHAVTQDDLLGDGKGKPHGSNVTGPLDVLLAGSDFRHSWKNTGEKPRTDTIMWLHIPRSLDRAYLLSIPRDLKADIPADKHAGFDGATDKINAAFHFGARDYTDVAGGMTLLKKTLKQVTDEDFQMAALVNWDGFKAITAELGGVTLCLDKGFRSSQPGFTNEPPFPAGCHHYDAGRALALVRQRDDYPDGDYGRQRMQQQFIKQILKEATSSGVLTSPTKINRILEATRGTLTVDLNGYQVTDLALALHQITTDRLITLQVAHETVPGTSYEQLVNPIDKQLFAALRNDTVDDFLLQHPELISKGPGSGH